MHAVTEDSADLSQYVRLHWLAHEATKWSTKQYSTDTQDRAFGAKMSAKRKQQLEDIVTFLQPLVALAPPAEWSPHLLK